MIGVVVWFLRRRRRVQTGCLLAHFSPSTAKRMLLTLGIVMTMVVVAVGGTDSAFATVFGEKIWTQGKRVRALNSPIYSLKISQRLLEGSTPLLSLSLVQLISLFMFFFLARRCEVRWYVW